MSRSAAVLIVGLVVSVSAGRALSQEPSPNVIEATKVEIWTLGGQQWEFKDIAASYVPVKGELDTKTGMAKWVLEIVKDLAPGEVALHKTVEGSPFKPTLLDGEKIVALKDAPTRIGDLAGKMGDRVIMTVQLPKADVLDKVKLIRIERRTKVGF